VFRQAIFPHVQGGNYLKNLFVFHWGRTLQTAAMCQFKIFSSVPQTSARTQLVIGFGTDGSNGRPTSSVKVSMAGLLARLTHRCDLIFGLIASLIRQSECVGIDDMAVNVQGLLHVISVLSPILL
jgi:hypothetical protein